MADRDRGLAHILCWRCSCLLAVPTCRYSNHCDACEYRYRNRANKQWLPTRPRFLSKRKERRRKRLLSFRIDLRFRLFNREFIRIVDVVRRKRDTRRDVLVQTPQTFEYHLGPRLIDSATAVFHVRAKFELSVRKSQRIVNGVDSMQHTDARVNYRPGLQIKVSSTLRIQNFKTSALSLIAEKLDQF